MRKENMIMAALWFGNQKPSMATFLKPFLDSMNKLNEGISCFAESVGHFICKGFLLCGTADLPARSLLCNSTQFNGAFSCWKCTHVFPFSHDDPKGPERTLSSIYDDAKKAAKDKQINASALAVNGIKGPSRLIFFPKFDLAHGIEIDYMHGVLLGVQKLLLRLWISQEYSTENSSFSKDVLDVDEKTPTSEISKLPRSISNELKYWKASEFRSFLLYYGAIVQAEVIDNERFSHYLLLVNAIHILLKTRSDDIDINRAEDMLFNFCSNFARLYKASFMTLNIHQLVHLADSVRYLGPLYTHSCFSFEDNNGFILKMIRGTQCIDNQITTGISLFKKLPEFRQNCLPKDSKEEELYKSIEFSHLLKRGEQICDNMFVLGSIQEKEIDVPEFRALSKFLGHLPSTNKFRCFKRLEMNDMIVYGTSYNRMINQDNSAICYKRNNQKKFGRVNSFLQMDINNSIYNLAIVQVLLVPCYNEQSSILLVQITDQLDVLPVTDILETTIFTCVSTDDKKGYVCLFPNRLESY